MTVPTVLAILTAAAVGGFGLSLLVRRLLAGRTDIDTSPWTSTLGYVAATHGVILGFTIVFLFGEFSAARDAIGAEARAIRTAFDETQLFPDSQVDIQHALICYSRAVPESDWQALRSGDPSPEVSDAYSDVFATLATVTESTDGTFQPATATNLVLQVGNIGAARAVRIVAAEIRVPPMLWGLLVFGGVLVVALLFVITLRAHRLVQASLIGVSAVFTAVMLLLVLALSSPFSAAAGRLSPALIEDTTSAMESIAPAAAVLPCPVEPSN